MKIHFDKNYNDKLKNTCVTIGTFDGLHKGHQNILSVLKNIAKEKNLETLVVTFDPHPRTVVSNKFDIKILTILPEKIKILEDLNIDNLYIINFTEKFSDQTSKEFIENYIVEKFDAKHVVIGHDHKFGKDRNGDEEELQSLGQKYGFGVTAVPAVKEYDVIISSTKVRNALTEGKVELAGSFLGREYLLWGKVVEGAKRGRILGFPTANIHIENKNKLIPKAGVYAVECNLEGEKLNGVMNIGYRPTFEDTEELVLEVHLLNFNRDIYGKELDVFFVKRIRDEKKFSSKEELIEQIDFDKKEAARILEIEIAN